MKMKNILIAILLICAITLLPTACRHNVNTANPQVVFAASLLEAADCVDTVATGLVAANDTIESLKGSEPDYYAHAKVIIVKVARATDTARTAVAKAKNGDTAADWKSALTGISASVAGEDLTKFGFKNPDSQKKVQVGLASFAAAIAAIPVFSGGN